MGAISGAATGGIGQMFGPVGGMGIGGEIARAYTHGFSNGMISHFSGGDFTQGFVSGGLGSLAGSAFQMYGGSFASSAVGTYAFSALAAGTGAATTGGNFLQGAATGLMTAGLNHLQHKVELGKHNTIGKRIQKILQRFYDKRVAGETSLNFNKEFPEEIYDMIEDNGGGGLMLYDTYRHLPYDVSVGGESFQVKVLSVARMRNMNINTTASYRKDHPTPGTSGFRFHNPGYGGYQQHAMEVFVPKSSIPAMKRLFLDNIAR